MGSLNKAQLIGYLGRDAEVRYTQGGQAVATINLATTEKWTDRQTQEKKEQTEWHRVVLWGKTAESLKGYLLKGKQIYVDGQLQTRKWTDKDGVERYTTEIRAFRVTLLGGRVDRRPEPGDPDEAVSTTTAEEPAQELMDDDIPF